MAFNPFEKIDEEYKQFQGIDPGTGEIQDNDYYYNPFTGKSDAVVSNNPEEEAKGAGFFGRFIDSLQAGASNVIAGQGDFINEFTGIGGDGANELNQIAKRNARLRNWSADQILADPFGYIKDPEGLTYDVGNMAGSGLALGGEAAAASVIGGEAAAAAGIGNLSTLSSTLANKAAAHGLGSLAKALNSKWGPLIVGNLVKTPFEAISEGGNEIQDMREEGRSDSDIKKAALKDTGLNMLFLALSNSAESLGFGSALGKKISSRAGKAALGLAGLAGGAAHESYEEGVQRGISDWSKDENGDYSVLNPFNWSPGAKDEAMAAFGPGMVFGGTGAALSRIGNVGNNAGNQGAAASNSAMNEGENASASESAAAESEESAVAENAADENGGTSVDDVVDAMTQQESSGNPNAVNENTGAFGKMQIMPENWPKWSQEALGRVGDMNNQDDYDAVVSYKMNQYINEYGTEGAMVAWYAGPQNAQRWVDGMSTGIDADGNEYSFDAPLSNGPSVNEYVRQSMDKLGKKNGGGSTGPAFNPSAYADMEGTTWNRTEGVDVENTQDVTRSGLADISKVYYDMFGIPLTVTSGNDSDVHQPGEHSHYAGVKLDVSGGVLDDAKKRHQFIAELEKRGITVLDEYENPSPNSTGGHLDLDFTDYKGAGNSRSGSSAQSNNSIPSLKEMLDYLKDNQMQFNDPDLNNAIDDALTGQDPQKVEDVFKTVKEQNEADAAASSALQDELNDKPQQQQEKFGGEPQGTTTRTQETRTAGPQQAQQQPKGKTGTQQAAPIKETNVYKNPSQIVSTVTQDNSNKKYSEALVNLAVKTMNGDKQAAETFSKIRPEDQKALLDIARQQQAQPSGNTANTAQPAQQAQTLNNKYSPVGNETTIQSDDSTKFGARYRLTDADDLITSHNLDNGMGVTVNPAYPSLLQPRDRANRPMWQQVVNIASNLDPSRLMDSQMINTGAPVVNSNGIVLNGNGRMMAIKRAYDTNKGDAYKTALKQNAERLGLNPSDVDKFKKPVLVRQVDAPLGQYDKIISSKVGGADMNATEQAKMDAKKIRTSTLEKYVDNAAHTLDNQTNRTGFVSGILADITGGDVGKLNPLVNSNLEPSQEGVKRAENALFALAYGDDKLLDRAMLDSDDNTRNVTNAMKNAAPQFALLKKLAEDGLRYNVDVTAPMVEACNKLYALRKAGAKLDIYLKEQAMFKDVSPEAHTILEYINGNARSTKAMTEYYSCMASMIDALGNPQEDQTAMFQDVGTSPVQVTAKDIIEASYARMKGEMDNAIRKENQGIPQDDNAEQGNRNDNPEPGQAQSAAGENGVAPVEDRTGEGETADSGSKSNEVQADNSRQTGEVNSEADAEQKISSIVGKEEIVINTAKNTDRQELEATIENRTKSAITTQMMGAVADGNNELARIYDQLSRKFRDPDYKKSLVNRIADNVLNRLKETTGKSQAIAQQENKPAVDTTQKPYSNGKFTVDTYEHTKTHQQLARVAFNKGYRVSHDDYAAMRDLAQKHNGKYSRFGGINAFLFPTDVDRDGFLNEGRSKFDFPTPEKEAKKERRSERYTADEEDYKKSYAELEEIADKISKAKTVDEIPTNLDVKIALEIYTGFPITDGRLSDMLRQFARGLKDEIVEKRKELEGAKKERVQPKPATETTGTGTSLDGIIDELKDELLDDKGLAISAKNNTENDFELALIDKAEDKAVNLFEMFDESGDKSGAIEVNKLLRTKDGIKDALKPHVHEFYEKLRANDQATSDKVQKVWNKANDDYRKIETGNEDTPENIALVNKHFDEYEKLIDTAKDFSELPKEFMIRDDFGMFSRTAVIHMSTDIDPIEAREKDLINKLHAKEKELQEAPGAAQKENTFDEAKAREAHNRLVNVANSIKNARTLNALPDVDYVKEQLRNYADAISGHEDQAMEPLDSIKAKTLDALKRARARLAKSDNGSKRYEDGSVVTPGGKVIAPIDEWKDPKKNPFVNGQALNMDAINNLSEEDANKVLDMLSDKEKKDAVREEEKNLPPIQPQDFIIREEKGKYVVSTPNGLVQKYGLSKTTRVFNLMKEHNGEGSSSNPFRSGYKCRFNTMEDAQDFVKAADDIINDRNQEAPEPKPQPVAKAKPEKNPQKGAEDYFKNHFIVTTAPPDVQMTPAVKNDTMKAEEKEGTDHDGTARRTEEGSGSLAGGHKGVQPEVLQSADEKGQGTSAGRNSKNSTNGSRKGEKVSGGRTGKSEIDNELHGQPEPDRGSKTGSQGNDAGGTDGYIPEVKAKSKKSRVNDYHMTEAPSYEGVGEKTLFDQNIKAIKLLKQLQMDNRMATKDEQAVLAKYSGWGTLASAFTGNPAWQKENAELRDTLTKEEYESAKSTVDSAFYTPPKLVQEIWDGLKKAGFKGGKVLDPSMGTGIFYATMPKKMYDSSQLYGVEMEKLSGDISKQLYQSADINIAPYEETRLAPDFFDLAITNVPFSSIKPYDSKYNKDKLQLHNYYFVKSLNLVRPGGLVAFITSTSTMDNRNEGKKARAAINKMADLVAAYRLPDTTFKQSAKTSVTSDIIILQRRENPKKPAPYAQSWMDTTQVYLDEKKRPGYKYGVDINEYFKNHPENILGRPVADSQYSNYDFHASVDGTGVDVVQALKKAMSSLPANLYKPLSGSNDKNDQKVTFLSDNKRDFTIIEKDGKLFENTKGRFTELQLSEDKANMVRGYIALREIGKKLLDDQSNPDVSDSELEKERKQLNDTYDSFVKKYGYINKKSNVKYYRNDPDYGLVGAFERYTGGTNTKKETAEKADIFFKRTIGQRKLVTHANDPTDALAISISQKGKVDMDYMAQLLGTKNKDAIYEKLQGQIFKDPASNDYVLAEEYLSGNVRKKLLQAQNMAKVDSSYKVNEEALKRVQPAPLNETQINVNIGANWIPVSVYNQFLDELVGRDSIKLSYSDITSKWLIESGNGLRYNGPEYSKWSTSRKSFKDILSAALNMKNLVVTKKVDVGDSTKEEVDVEATEAANAKLDALKETFTNWLWKDPARKKKLLEIYNNTYNDNVLRHYDGSHLNFENGGMNKSIKLRPHQKDAVWRIMQRKNVLLAHCVGSGKTFTMQAAGMEMKRLGIINKPMYSVPNNVVPQFANDLRTLYPDAKILTLTSAELPGAKITDEFSEKLDTVHHKDNDAGKKGSKSKKPQKQETAAQRSERLAKRRRTLSRIATEDWDAIIISHELLKQMPMSPEVYNAFYKEQVEQLDQAVTELKADGDKNNLTKRQLKALEEAKKNLEAKLKRDIKEENKEVVIPFEKLGVDQLFIDEADLFKNLTFYTTHDRLKGISTSHSARATDLYVKTRWLSKRYDGGGVCFATGTPISNSMNEMYTMMRYLDYSGLEASRLLSFDSWLTQYGQVTTEYEPDATGDKPQKVERATFNNVPQLVSQYRKFADIKMIEDLPYLVLPKLKDGHDTVIEVPASDTFKNVIKPQMVERLKNMKRSYKMEKGDDNPLKWIGDYRKMTLDLRLYDKSIPESEAANKINACADTAYKKWKETTKATDKTAENGAQLIFCDLISSDNKKDKKNENVTGDDNKQNDEFAEESKEAKSTYQWIKDGLVRRGIPENEIAFAHDAKNNEEKKALFDRVDRGEVRILIGSTAKMGAGTNCQHHLVALHHLTLPYRPRDIEQREGRILRQGNLNKEVEIFHYVTKGSFDQYNLNMLKNKAEMIHAVMHGDSDITSIEDVGEDAVNFGDLEIIATQDPRMREFGELTGQVNKLKIRKNAWIHEMMDKNQQLARIPMRITHSQNELAASLKDIKARKNIKGDNFKIVLNGHTFTKQKYAQDYLKQHSNILEKPVKTVVGSIAGFKISVIKNEGRAPSMELEGPGMTPYIVPSPYSIISIATTANNAPDKLKTSAEEELNELKRSKEILEEEVKKPFRQEDELREAIIKLNKLKAEIDKTGNGASTASQKAATMETEATEVSNQFSIVSEDALDPNIQRSLDSLKQEVQDAFPQAKISDIDASTMKVETPAGTITVDLQKKIVLGEQAEKKAKQEHGIASNDDIVVEGYYKRPSLDRDAVIALSQESSEGSAYHEAFHAAWDMALTDKEKAAMNKYYSKHANGKAVNEAMADGYKAWKRNRAQGKGSMFGKLFQKIKDFVAKVKTILTGVENVHNVMRKVAEGDVWNRSATINDASMKVASYSAASQQQEYKSKDTSRKQIAAIFKAVPWKSGTTNIDIGGGKYDLATDYMKKEHGVENIVYDPYNRTKEWNLKALEAVKGKGDTVTVANVLNVIKESAWRKNVILQAAKALKPDGTAYFQIYEGDESGVGNATQKQESYQNNMKTADYVPEIERYFADVERHGKLIIAKDPVFDPDEKAVWSVDDLATDDLAFSVRNANDNLKDSFGMKLKKTKDGVKVRMKFNDKEREFTITQSLFRSPSYIAEHVPVFKLFFKMADRAMSEQEHLRNSFNKKLNRIHKLYLHSKDDIKQWSDILWQGDAEGKEYSKEELKAMGLSDNVISAYRATRIAIAKAYDLLNEARLHVQTYQKNVTKEGYQELANNKFVDIQKVEQRGDNHYIVTFKKPKTWKSSNVVTKKVFDEMKRNENVRIISSKKVGSNAYDVAYEERMGDIHKRGGYIPHFFHNFFVMDTDADGNNVVVGSGRTVKEALKVCDAYAKTHKDAQLTIAPKTFTFADDSAVRAAEISDGQYFAMVSKIEEQLKMTPEQAREFLSDKVKMAGRHRFFGNFLERKGALGFEQNMNWVLAHYFNSVSRYVALEGFKPNAISLFERYFGDFNKDHKNNALAEYVKKYIQDINGNPNSIELKINDWLNHQKWWRDFVASKYGDRAALQLTQNITSVIGIAKLGFGNVSSALLNLGQIVNAVGITGDMKATARAMKDALRSDYKVAKILHDCGVVDDIRVDAGSSGYTAFRPRNLLGKTMFMFSTMDMYSRKVAALSGFYHAMKEGKNYKDSIEFGRTVNRKANFDYSPADAPAIFRSVSGSVVGDVALQFQKYKVKEMELMYDIAKHGDFGKNVKFWGMYFMLAGLLQFPAVDWFNDLFKQLLGVDYKLKLKGAVMDAAGNSEVGRSLAKIAMYGLLSAKPINIDISQRFGMGDFVVPPQKTLVDILGGPTLSTATQMYLGIHNNNPLQVIKGFSPALGNYAQVLMERTVDKRGRTMRELESPYDKLVKAIGFRLADESINSDISQIKSQRMQEAKDERQNFVRELLDKEESGEQRSQEDIKKMKELGITNKKLKAYRNDRNRSYKDRINGTSSKNFKKDNEGLLNFNN